MNEEEIRTAKELGIVVSQKTTYAYKGYKYDSLKDAINFAKADIDREKLSENT